MKKKSENNVDKSINSIKKVAKVKTNKNIKDNSKKINLNTKDDKEKVVEQKIDFKNLKYSTTKDIPIPKLMIDQVVGQEDAVNVIKKAAQQRRHVLLIGEPGTGKSMLGVALAELLPKEKLVDVLALPNPNDENQPLIRTIAGGKGREVVTRAKLQNGGALKTQNIIMLILAVVAMVLPWWVRSYYKSDIMFAAFFLGGMMFLLGFVLFMNVGKKMIGNSSEGTPKVIVDNFDKEKIAFYDATGAHAGALLGDVLHDPFQSGGLGTPANERVIAGMIHKANMGVLFIDEISTLEPASQQDLLTALQEGKYPITGQSERSAGQAGDRNAGPRRRGHRHGRPHRRVPGVRHVLQPDCAERRLDVGKPEIP